MKVVQPLRRATSVIAIFGAIMLMGCGAKSIPVTYYTLNPIGPGASAAAPDLNISRLIVGIGPTRLPAYLDRLQIVSRSGPNRLRIDDFQRWAAPLDKDVARVLGENLRRLTGISRSIIYPWSMNQRPDLSVEVDIHSFESQNDAKVLLNATVTVYDRRDNGTTPRTQNYTITQPVTAAGNLESIVAAQNQALIELSRHIADTILTLIKEG